jgi:hypothetical protein
MGLRCACNEYEYTSLLMGVSHTKSYTYQDGFGHCRTLLLSPSMSVSQHLPHELIERIVSYLHEDQPALLCCSLVHRSWTLICQAQLFRTITIFPERGADSNPSEPASSIVKDPWLRLVNLLKNNLHLRPLVREVIVVANPLPAALKNTGYADGVFPRVSMLKTSWIPLSAALLGIFPTLTELEVVGAPTWGPTQGLSHPSTTLPRLKRLSLRSIADPENSLLACLCRNGMGAHLVSASLECAYPGCLDFGGRLAFPPSLFALTLQVMRTLCMSSTLFM